MAGEYEKELFLKEFGQDYGYPNAPKNIDDIRATEFKRLNDEVYLDHAGATLYSESQMEDIFRDFNSTIYGNPHSQSNCSLMTSDVVGEARRQVLSFFNASPGEYNCIFTSGATSALKLVGETFPWSSQSTYMYTMENHNSVLGIREYALEEGAAAIAVDIEDDRRDSGESPIKIVPHTELRRVEAGCRKKHQTSDTYNLFAFPSECNFSGRRFNLDLVTVIKEGSYEMPRNSPPHRGGWMVLIDAAKGSATCPPDLSKFKADFVVVSFYKLFGYPTGIGALIAKNEAAKLLKKTYFSGGTVAASIADIDFHKRRDGIEEYFEDGTLSFASIASLHHGFKILNTLTMPAISRHTSLLASYVRNAMLNLRHVNGNHVCTLYGLDDPQSTCDAMGPIVSFNMRRPDGSWVGYREVEKLASLSNIQLRDAFVILVHAQNFLVCLIWIFFLTLRQDMCAGMTVMYCTENQLEQLGCHLVTCQHLKMSWYTFMDLRSSVDHLDAKFKFFSFVLDSYVCTGIPLKFLKFIDSSFVPQVIQLDLFRRRPFHPATEGVEWNIQRCLLKSITIYPIKSCVGFSVESWPLSNTGLLYDREWLLKSLSGEILTQKKVPEMGFITTLVDLKLGLLAVNSPRCKEELQIELASGQSIGKREVMEIHSQRYEVRGHRNEVDIWFSNAVGRPCTLVRSYASQNHLFSNRDQSMLAIYGDMESKLNFVNEAQFLLVSEESVADLNNKLRSKLKNGSHKEPCEVDPMRFRPNLIVSGGRPYEEDGWKSLKIGERKFMSLGGCNRCQMINMTYSAGTVERSNEPLATLASYRRLKGKIYFGVLLRLCDDRERDAWLSVGQEIVANTD